MAIYSGETVNDAIEKGLKDLGIDKKHAKISVIQEPKPGILGKFRKEAKVEIIILTDADLEKKKKLIKFGIIGGVIVFFVIFLNMVFSGNSTSTVSSDNNELSVPIASSELATQNYESVVEQFKNAGFTNIVVRICNRNNFAVYKHKNDENGRSDNRLVNGRWLS